MSGIKFSDVLEGKRARKPVKFPMPIDRVAEPGAEPVFVDLVVLGIEEDAECDRIAREHAVASGITKPEKGDTPYDLELMVQVLLRSVLVHDPRFLSSDVELPAEPFFTDVVKLRKRLDRERLQYLYQLQQTFQDEVSPHGTNKTEEELMQLILQLSEAESPLVPFELLRPAMLGRLTLTMAKRLAAAHLFKSPGGTPSSSNTSSSGRPNTPQPASS